MRSAIERYCGSSVLLHGSLFGGAGRGGMLHLREEGAPLIRHGRNWWKRFKRRGNGERRFIGRLTAGRAFAVEMGAYLL